MSQYAIELKGITKTFGSVVANNNVQLNVRPGEILALLGEKFKTVRGGKGIAYTIPLKSVVGVAIYRFLTNNRMPTSGKGEE